MPSEPRRTSLPLGPNAASQAEKETIGQGSATPPASPNTTAPPDSGTVAQERLSEPINPRGVPDSLRDRLFRPKKLGKDRSGDLTAAITSQGIEDDDTNQAFRSASTRAQAIAVGDSRDDRLSEGEIALAHISDLHFGYGKPGDDEKAWALLEQILRSLKPCLLLVSGDLVDTPKRRHFHKAFRNLEAIKIPYYACLGNHDCHRKGNRIDHRLIFGNLRFRTACSATCVIAALASYHGIGWWVLLLLALAVAPWVAPRIISWLWNAVGNNLLDKSYAESILGHTKATPFNHPREGEAEWKIGLLGLDSSAEADVSARGKVNVAHFLPLENATRNEDWDLCICLVHHHPISIRGLERSRESDPLKLLNLTSLVNSGSLLEALVRAQVDLLLHGHEHEHNWLTYSTCNPGYEPLRVVAAGSATGMGDKGYNSDRATFNLIILAPDRSVRLRRYYFHAGEWKTEVPDIPLFDAGTLRPRRLRRLFAVRRIFSEITKYVEYTRERDIWVSWEYRNWMLPKQEFVQEIWNTTGELDDVTAQVSFADGGGHTHKLKPTYNRVEDKKHAWEIRWRVESGWSDKTARVRIGYRFRGGGLLTAEEMEYVRQNNLAGETPRLKGSEYETVWTPLPVAAAQLIVVLPQEYAPEGRPTISVELETHVPGPTALHPGRKEKKEFPGEVSELDGYLSFPAKGMFALRVPYPCPYYDYTLSWKPVGEATVAETMDNQLPESHFQKVAYEKGENLLEAFANILAGKDYLENATLALYVREDISKVLTLVRTAWKWLGTHNEQGPEPPPRIPFTGEHQATTLAWWGQFGIWTRPGDDTTAITIGFAHPREQALCCVPIRFNLESMTNPPPWGLVRIAIIPAKGRGLQAPKSTDILQRTLSAATTALLSAALQEDLLKGK